MRAVAPPRMVELPRSLERALAAGHPWVYRDHVPRSFSAPSGTWVRVRAGEFAGWALWDATSAIALRLVAAKSEPDLPWLAEQISQAWALREPLRRAGVTAYRVLSGEGDGLPGVVADLYGRHAIVVTIADGAARLAPDVARTLARIADLDGVSLRRREDGDEREVRLESLWGVAPPREIVVEEYGARFAVDVHSGQKTGLFLDQRENRRWIAGLCAGRTVLNLFSYTGAFSVHAALGGAARVTSVDVARAATHAARESFRLSGLDPDAHDFVARDCFEYLEQGAGAATFDVVISDPPSFAKSRAQLPAALKSYRRLTVLGLRRTAPYGLYAAASCTSQVSPEAFRELVADAARRARRRFQIIHEAGHALDHPIFAGHPEGRYLKFLVGRVLPP